MKELPATFSLPSGPLLMLWRGWLRLSLYGLLAVMLINFSRLRLYARLAPPSSIFNRPAVMIAAFLFILLLVSAVHELGHLTAGRLAGLRFQLLVVGPLHISRHAARGGARLRLRLSRGPLFNGLVASVPPTSHRLRRRMLLFAAGGPAASLLLVAAAGGLFWRLRATAAAWQQAAWLGESALVTAVVSGFFFLTAMQPGRYPNGLPADGARLAMLLRGGALADRWCALVRLHAADAQGQRPRHWPAHLVQQGLSAVDGSLDDLTALLLAYQWALDGGRVDQAAAYIATALETPPAWLAGATGRMALEQAYLQARYRDNPADARAWLDRVRAGRSPAPAYARAAAAVLLAENRPAAAAAHIAAGLAALAAGPATGTAQAEQAWLAALQPGAQTAPAG